MPGQNVWLSALFMALALSGCKLINTEDDENVSGRGAAAFDPYAGPASGAIRLSLQMYKGCAVLPTGEPFGKGAAKIPYPDNCRSPNLPPDQAPPLEPMKLLVDTDYFLYQFTVMDAVTNVHNDPRDETAVLRWLKNESALRGLDWTNVSKIADRWTPMSGNHPNAFTHLRLFGNANWQLKKDDTFKVEVLDVEGNVRASETYERRQFLAENPVAGHTQIGWEHRNIGPPRFSGDLEVNPVPPADPGYGPPQPPSTYTYVRYDVVLSTTPEKRIRIDRTLTGDGAIRVTWSQLPDQPFYFPVRFIRADQLPKSCFVDGDENKPVACTFGLKPMATLSRPKNGKFYVPGEKVNFRLAVADGNGNYLHPKDHFPSWNDYIRNQSNGLSYATLTHFMDLMERNSMSVVKVIGPLQDVGPYYDPGTSPYFQFPEGDALQLNEIVNAVGAIAGGRNLQPPTTWTVTLPANAKPGTYALLFKVHRFFLGERFSKIEVFHFPVGQEERTLLPGRIGNCQLCHRGKLSLDNVGMGLDVDHVEACRGCHNRDAPLIARAGGAERLIHAVHSSSLKFPMSRTDCTVCHLTKASAIRPSINACEGCHPSIHGGEYDSLRYGNDLGPGGVFGNCASSCHEKSLPKSHIYPAQ